MNHQPLRQPHSASAFRLTALVLLGCCVSPVYALQGLCENSPENPTLVLGLLGAAAAGYPYLRGQAQRLFRRKDGEASRD